MNAFHRLRDLQRDNDATGRAMNAMRPRFEGYRTRHEDGTAPRAIAAYNLFQTPCTIAARMVALAGILPHHSVLEPSAGLGRILRHILATKPARVAACDVSPDCCRELFEQFPAVELHQGDFLARDLGTFDRIISNAPYHMRADIAHMRHALTHLAPDGVMVGLCMSGPHREREIRPLCDLWEVLPPGAFASEGTSVSVTLFRITLKNSLATS